MSADHAGSGALSAGETRFDVRDYARNLQGSLRDSVDADALAARPLAPNVVDALRFLRDAERGTMTQLRDMLVTPTHKDARVTAFLTAWAYEKFWIADALAAVLDAADPADPSATESSPRQRRLGRLLRGARDRLRPLRLSIAGSAIGTEIVAVHVTLAVADEWVTRAWYDRIDAVAGRPELTTVLDRIRSVKDRHERFFVAESRDRLGRSRRGQRLTASRLRSARFPVAGPATSGRETAAIGAALFAGARGRLAEVAGRIRSLPGQERTATTVEDHP